MIDITLYKVTLSDYYYWGSEKEQFLEAQQKFRNAGVPLIEWVEGNNNHNVVEALQIVDQSTLTSYAIAGLQFTSVEPVVTQVNIAEHLTEMAEKQINIQAPGRSEYNTLCEVHMPGQALSLYNDMKLLEDSCTDALQEALNEGWRIIAACPQPSQRRPDYILGRFDPRHNGDRSAKRE